MFPPSSRAPLTGGSQLDMPPPSPALAGLPRPGELAPPVIASNQLPPEILTGMMAAAQQISKMLDSFAQATPDLSADWSLVKALLQRTLGKLLVAGAQATSPTEAGPAFPGGGFAGGQP